MDLLFHGAPFSSIEISNIGGVLILLHEKLRFT